ncbi:unnamed protein product [Pieris macdunnoughi]|uniref:Uncharacterized protein n=1 Tax=Pieris macdunnoughi TaxID=345717 RepID=A0A821V9E1_9NEOP|nr:unnamed protein product [Pieris macdunnoughi]
MPKGSFVYGDEKSLTLITALKKFSLHECPATGTDQTCSWGTKFRFNVRSLDVCRMKNRQFQSNSIRVERKVKKVSCVNFFRDRKIGVAAPGDTYYTNGGTMQTAARC